MKRECKLAYERTFYGGIGQRTADIEVFAEDRDNVSHENNLLRREEPCHVKDIFRKEMY